MENGSKDRETTKTIAQQLIRPGSKCKHQKEIAVKYDMMDGKK